MQAEKSKDQAKLINEERLSLRDQIDLMTSNQEVDLVPVDTVGSIFNLYKQKVSEVGELESTIDMLKATYDRHYKVILIVKTRARTVQNIRNLRFFSKLNQNTVS